MKRKKKPGLLQRLRTGYKQNRRKVLLVFAAIVLIGILSYWFFHERAQRHLEAAITEAGVQLDAIEAEIKKSDMTASTKRSAFCYHAGRKSGREPIYCVQRLWLWAENVSEEEILRQEEILRDLLYSSTLKFEATEDETQMVFGQTHIVRAEYLDSVYLGRVNCRGNFRGYGDVEVPPDRPSVSHNEYEARIDCLGANFDDFFYPELDL